MSGQITELGIKIRYDGKEVEAGAGVSRDAIKQLSSEAKGAVESAGASYTKASTMAVSSIDKIGVSVAQTANAMRMLPAQITDIVTGLASGQQPLTVLIQQGGQIKDMFGGVGPAMRAVAGSVLSVTGVTAAAIAGVGGLAYAVKQGSEEFDAYRRQVLAANAASAASVGNISAISASINASAGATKGALNELLTGTAANGKIAVDQLSEVADVAIRLERAGVDAADETIKRFEALGNKPAEAVLKLDEKYRFLTASTYAHIKALQDEGRETEAAAVAQKSYADALEARLPSIEQNLGTVERWWRAIKDATLGAVDAIKDIGRSKSIDEQIATLQGRIDAARKNASGSSANEAFAAENIPAWQQQIDFLKQQGQIEARNALARADADITRQASLKKEVDVSALRDKYLTNEVKLRQEIKRINESTGTDAEKAAWIKQATESLTPKTAGSTKTDWKQIYDARLAAEKDYSETQIGLVKQRVAQGLLSEEQGAAETLALQKDHYLAQTALLAEQLAATKGGGDKAKIGQELQAVANDAQTAQAAYETALAKMAQERDKYRRSVIESIDAATAKTEQENDALRAQIDTLGMTSEQIGEYEASKKRAAAASDYLAAATLREAASTMEAAGDAADVVQYYRQLADAREAAGKALSTQASLEIEKGVKQSAIDAQKEWQKTSDKIGESLTDALMRGFESGKSFAENLRDSTVNMFKSMVLQPVIKATVVGGLSAVGLGSSEAAASSSNSLGSLASLGNNTYSLFSGGGTASGLYNSFALSGAGSALGLSTGLSTSLGVAGGAGTTMGASAALAASEATSAGATGLTAAGSTTAAAIPYVGGAIAAIALISSMMGKGGGPKTEGDAYGTYDSTGYFGLSAADRAGDNWITGTNSNAVVESLIQPIGTSVAGLIKSLGGNANGLSFNLGFSTDRQGTADDNIQSGVMDAAGNYVYRNGRNAERGSYQTELNLEAQRMMVAAVKAADISQVYKDVANSVDLYTASAEQLQTVLSNITAISSLRTAFDKINLGADALTTTLIGAAGGIDTLASATSSYYDGYFTQEEKTAKLHDELATAFAALNETMPTTRAGLRSLIESVVATGSEGEATAGKLLALSPSFGAWADAAKEAAAAAEAAAEKMKAAYNDAVSSILSGVSAGVDDAYSALERSVSAQKEAAQAAYEAQAKIREDQISAASEVRSTLVSLADALANAVGTVAADSDANLRALRKFAQNSLNVALAAAQSGQSLALYSDAISAAIADLSKPSEQLYGSYEDYARDQGRANAAMAALKPLATDQLSVASRTLTAMQAANDAAAAQYARETAAFDKILTDSKAQIDALNGINTGVQTIGSAIAALASALSLSDKVSSILKPTTPTTSTTTPAATTSTIVDAYSNLLGRAPDASGLVYWQQQANAGVSAATISSAIASSPEGQVASLYSTLLGRMPDSSGSAYWQSQLASGASVADVTAAIKASAEYKNSHASGLERVPYDGYRATLHAGEAVVDAQSTRAISRYFGGAGGSNNAALIAEIKALRDEVSLLRYEARATATNTNKTAKALERVMPDGDALATRAAA